MSWWEICRVRVGPTSFLDVLRVMEKEELSMAPKPGPSSAGWMVGWSNGRGNAGGEMTPGSVLEPLSTWQIPDINHLEVGTVSPGPRCQRFWSMASGAHVSGPAVQTSFMEKPMMEECWSVPGSQETEQRVVGMAPFFPSFPLSPIIDWTVPSTLGLGLLFPAAHVLVWWWD